MLPLLLTIGGIRSSQGQNLQAVTALWAVGYSWPHVCLKRCALATGVGVCVCVCVCVCGYSSQRQCHSSGGYDSSTEPHTPLPEAHRTTLLGSAPHTQTHPTHTHPTHTPHTHTPH